MANPITCKISGLDELQVKLEALPKAVAKSVLKGGLKDAAQHIADEMAARVPHEHPEFDTGLLAKSINVKIKVETEDIAATAFIGPASGVDYPKAKGKK